MNIKFYTHVEVLLRFIHHYFSSNIYLRLQLSPFFLVHQFCFFVKCYVVLMKYKLDFMKILTHAAKEKQTTFIYVLYEFDNTKFNRIRVQILVFLLRCH